MTDLLLPQQAAQTSLTTLPTTPTQTSLTPNQRGLQKVATFFTTYGPFVLLVTAAVVITLFFSMAGLILAPALLGAARRPAKENENDRLLLSADGDVIESRFEQMDPQNTSALPAIEGPTTIVKTNLLTKITVIPDTAFGSTIPTSTISTTLTENCDGAAVGAYLSPLMQNPTLCVDEDKRLNLNCATKMICSARVLTKLGTDLSGVIFNFFAEPGTSEIFLSVTNGGLPIRFDNATFAAGGQDVTIVFYQSYLPESSWKQTQFLVPTLFDSSSVEGGIFSQIIVGQNHGYTRGLAISNTIVDGVVISSPSLISGAPLPNYATISFMGTQGLVTLSGTFDGVVAEFFNTKGDIHVSGVTMGQGKLANNPVQSLLISNSEQTDGSCLQSYVPSLLIKESSIRGLNTWPVFVTDVEPCGTPPVINTVAITASSIFCMQLRSDSPWANILLQDSNVTCGLFNQCSYDSGVIVVPSGAFTFSGSQLLNCATMISTGNTSTVESQYTTFAVNEIQSDGVFDGGQYASIDLNNTTSTDLSGNGAEGYFISLLRNLYTNVLSIGSSHFYSTGFTNVNVGRLVLTGPNTGNYVDFYNFGPVCHNGGKLPPNLHNVSVYCSPNGASDAAERSNEPEVIKVSGKGFFATANQQRAMGNADSAPRIRLN